MQLWKGYTNDNKNKTPPSTYWLSLIVPGLNFFVSTSKHDSLGSWCLTMATSTLSPYGVNSWLEKISFEKCRCFVLRFLVYIGHQHIPVHRVLRPEIFCVSFLHKDKVKLQPKNRRSLVSLGSSQKIHFALAPTFQFIIWSPVDNLFLITNHVQNNFLGVSWLNHTPLCQPW